MLRIGEDPIFQGFALANTVASLLQDDDQVVVLDLSLVTLVHSPMLANLTAIYVRLHRTGRRLQLRGLNPDNRKILNLTRLDSLFEIAAEG